MYLDCLRASLNVLNINISVSVALLINLDFYRVFPIRTVLHHVDIKQGRGPCRTRRESLNAANCNGKIAE